MGSGDDQISVAAVGALAADLTGAVERDEPVDLRHQVVEARGRVAAARERIPVDTRGRVMPVRQDRTGRQLGGHAQQQSAQITARERGA